MAKDKDYTRLINSPTWMRLRNAYIGKHPLCERCEAEGRVTAATEVHHRTPVEHGLTADDKRRLAYNPTNLQSLCHACHLKAHEELGRTGKAATRRLNDEKLKRFTEKFL